MLIAGKITKHHLSFVAFTLGLVFTNLSIFLFVGRQSLAMENIIMYQMKPYILTKSPSLRTERRLRGWSQARLAKELGVATRTVIRWEQGRTVPQPNHRKQLGSIFGKTAQELGLIYETPNSNAINVAQEVLASVVQRATPASTPLLFDPAIPQTLSSRGNLLGRTSLLMQVKKRLLQAESLPFTVISGWPGIGKTSLAVALATDWQVRLRFHDGILWAPLGAQPHVLGQLMRWGTLLGITPSDVENPQTAQAWGKALRSAIGTRQMLLIIDDAWTTEDALALQVGGPKCTHLLTTRLPQVASTLAQQPILVPQLEEADGLVLLARFVPQLVQQDPEGAQFLVQALCGLPLALTLMGKYLTLPTFSAHPWPLRPTLAQLRDTQERLCLSMPTASGPHGHRFAETVPLCLYATIAICAQQLSPQAHACLCALAVFPANPQSFSEEAALAMSQQPRKTLDVLCDFGLLENYGSRRYSLHQMIADYARAKITSQWRNGGT